MPVHINIKKDYFVNEPKTKTRGKANLGKPLEYLMNRSVLHYSMVESIMYNFHDTPRKHVLENRKLLCDKWFLTVGGVFVSIELKITRNGTNLPFANIERHQIDNLKRIEDSRTVHRGWMIVWFKDDRRSLGIYAIDGLILHHFVTNYSHICTAFDIDTNMENRKSISYKDIVYLAEVTPRVIALKIKKIINAYNNKEEDIICLEPLWGEKI